ncbi:type IV pilus assembly protein PilK [Pseudomonas duriflava]|uniref:protein-glutamate O-methyltransferase n=1 Tax=Pseudomonas duriflava TaxID=459528 RepID=A0A562QNS4_9PSED|nr:CheR family methyltransferase [Pseudomonas duriflava]TWI58411.1 type IV pilus assembly protein PilK [Pseudomonas duriflava]
MDASAVQLERSEQRVIEPPVEMLPTEFSDWQRLLESRVGIVINDRRRYFLQSHLTARMREVGIRDYAAYYRYVTQGVDGAIEWTSLLNHLTVQFTQFFRHTPSFEVMESYLSERLKTSPGKVWSLWSVGCSSGEEAYSMAITASEVLRHAGLPETYGVFGTDISSEALNRARLGLYMAQKVQSVEASLRKRYFQDHADGRLSIVPALRSRLCCARLNMLELAKAPLSGMDVIFCQNVLIYFRRWLRKDILNQLVNKLTPGGLLVIGVGEMSNWTHPELVPLGDERVLAFTRRVA